MLEVERINGETGEIVIFCDFTHDETYAMAKFVMDCLCLPWIDTYQEFDDLLRNIFRRSAQGKLITRTEACILADKYERYYKYGLPLFPKMRDGGRIVCPPHIHGDEATEWLIKTRTEIWHEVWELHKKSVVLVAIGNSPVPKPMQYFLRSNMNAKINSGPRSMHAKPSTGVLVALPSLLFLIIYSERNLRTNYPIQHYPIQHYPIQH